MHHLSSTSALRGSFMLAHLYCPGGTLLRCRLIQASVMLQAAFHAHLAWALARALDQSTARWAEL